MPKTLFDKAGLLAPESPFSQFNFFCYHFASGEESEAFRRLEVAFKNGLNAYLENPEIIQNQCFQEIQESIKYKQLLKTYKSP